MIIAKPYFNWITYTPLNTEIVDLAKAPSNKHYNALGGTHTNVLNIIITHPLMYGITHQVILYPSEPDIQLNNGDIPLGEYTNEDKVMNTKNMLPFEGDMILEGRFGNSIRFGSSNS